MTLLWIDIAAKHSLCHFFIVETFRAINSQFVSKGFCSFVDDKFQLKLLTGNRFYSAVKICIKITNRALIERLVWLIKIYVYDHLQWSLHLTKAILSHLMVIGKNKFYDKLQEWWFFIKVFAAACGISPP